MLRFDPNEFGKVDLFLVWTIFIFGILLLGFILMNLNVSMMKNYYDLCDRKSE